MDDSMYDSDDSASDEPDFPNLQKSVSGPCTDSATGLSSAESAMPPSKPVPVHDIADHFLADPLTTASSTSEVAAPSAEIVQSVPFTVPDTSHEAMACYTSEVAVPFAATVQSMPLAVPEALSLDGFCMATPAASYYMPQTADPSTAAVQSTPILPEAPSLDGFSVAASATAYCMPERAASSAAAVQSTPIAVPEPPSLDGFSEATPAMARHISELAAPSATVSAVSSSGNQVSAHSGSVLTPSLAQRSSGPSTVHPASGGGGILYGQEVIGRPRTPSRNVSRERMASSIRSARPGTPQRSSSRQHNMRRTGSFSASAQRPAQQSVPWCPAGKVSAGRKTPERQRQQGRGVDRALSSTVPASVFKESCAGDRFQCLSKSTPLMRFVPTVDWAQLPDVVLLQAIVLVGPSEVCATVAVCGTWAETVTASEAWLWSVVGGAGLAPEIFAMLRRWATATGMAMRHALQLWLCRAHLWGSGTPVANDTPWFPAGRKPAAAVSILPGPQLPEDGAPVCCTAWPAGGDCDSGFAIGTTAGILAFGCLETAVAPARGLRGLCVTGMELTASVRSAHGYQLMSAVRPFANGRMVISCGLDGLLRLWDPSTGAESAQIVTDHERGINDIALSANVNCEWAVSCGDDGLALVHDLSAPLGTPPLHRYQGHNATAYCATWTSASMFATGGFDRRALLWDCRGPQQPVFCLPARQHIYALAALRGAGSGGHCHNDARALAVAAADGTIAHWDLRQAATVKEPLREMRGHQGPVEALSVLPGDVLASASADGTLRLWDAAHGGEAAWLWTGRGPLTDVASVFDDTLIVSGLGMPPTVLTLDYVEAASFVPEVLERMQLPTLQPWRRGHLGTPTPPGGIGRHSDLLSVRRQRRGSRRGSETMTSASCTSPSTRGIFDRSQKSKPTPLGSTGAAHRAFLCGMRR